MKGLDTLVTHCTQIADRVVPEYRARNKSYSCTGGVAKRWQAAWDGACIALGNDPKEVSDAERRVRARGRGKRQPGVLTKKEGKAT
jgi:hypothetical protein